MFKSRRDFLKKSAQVGALGISSSMLSGCSTLMGFWSVEDRTDQVVIVGAGISGLSCAFSLKRAGLKYCLFEANQRIGGRILTQFDATPEGDVIELGGEFIHDNHSAMKDLAKYMSFPLKEIRENLSGAQVRDFKLQGKKWSQVTPKPLFRVEGGNSLLVRRLKDRVGGVVPETNLKTGHELISIRIQGPFYRLVFKTPKDGLKEIEARHVVLALPLSQLSRIDGLSLINPYLKDVFLQIQTVSTSKLILPIPQKLSLQKRKVAIIQDHQSIYYPSLNSDSSSSKAFYSTEVLGSEIDQNQIQSELFNFEKLTTHKIKTQDLLIKSWGKEPWIQMSYSKLLDASNEVNIESQIRSGLFLIGEHMSSKFMGTMNGAVETGQLAAERIVESVRKKQSEDSKVS